MSTLVVVESPGKVKKIQSYLGDDYEVIASVGHIRELPRDTLGFDIANNYEPEFLISSDKAEVVKKMKAKAKQVEKIILASDDDREGAAISWHVAEVCKIPLAQRHRATFTEITKKAITQAIANPGKIDMNMVYAQFARMVLDKLIGYKVSPMLWKEYNNWKLSAGRVQSVVVKIINERENEIAKFNSEAVFKLDANFVLDKKELDSSTTATKKPTTKFIATVCETDIKEQTKVESIMEHCKDQTAKWTIAKINKSTSKRNPPPPFITSTLQQDASAKLGMSPEICMKTAQKLYEAGMITYMRTDAMFIAEDAMKALKEYITAKWGESYYRRMDYKTKGASSQEAHECCRPTNISKESVMGIEGMTAQHNRLYQLIWRRTVASQMAPADFEIRNIKIVGEGVVFQGKHEKNLFEGFLACVKKTKPSSSTSSSTSSNTEQLDDPDQDPEQDPDSDQDDVVTNQSDYLEKIFEKLKEGSQVWALGIAAVQKFTKPSQSRYTEASLIKKLDDLGIGRPSTYASMIKKVQEEQRQYVEKKSLVPKKVKTTNLAYTYPDQVKISQNDVKIDGDKNKLFPTSLGVMITEYLDKNFMELMNYEFTAQIESLLDDIALGKKVWYTVVDSVYIKSTPIIDELSRAITTRKALQPSSNTLVASSAGDTANKRFLGNHPNTGLPVYAIKSRKGFLICESNVDQAKSRFASFNGRFDSITLEEAVSLIVFPRLLGEYEGKEVYLKKAKNVYLAYDGKNYSIESYMKMIPDNDIDPNSTSLDDSIMILRHYQTLDQQKAINQSLDRVLDADCVIKVGPFGPYIKYKGILNIPLPKALKTKWETVTLEECLPVIEKNKDRKPKGKATTKPKAEANAKVVKKAKESVETVETPDTISRPEPKVKKPSSAKPSSAKPKVKIVKKKNSNSDE
jgi:DNA topoisomerase-1